MDQTLMLFAGFSSLASGSASYLFFRQFVALKKKLKMYEDISVLTPDQLLSKFSSGLHQVSAFVIGEVNTKHPVYSELQSWREPLILLRTQILDLYTSQKQKVVQTITRCSPLMQVQENGVQMSIGGNSRVKVNSLEHIASLQIPYHINPLTYIVDFFQRILRALFRADANSYQGFRTAQYQQDFGIKVKEVLTIFGEVMIDADNKKMHMECPKYMLQSKIQLLRRLKAFIRNNNLYLMIFSILFVVSSYFFSKRIIYYILLEIKKRKRAKQDALWDIKKLEMGSYQCAICYDNPRQIVLKPCKHFSLCNKCFHQLQKQECPICKTPILDHIEIFIS